ncbi:MAG: TIGR02217 family protein [Alphaproteobacteria bacterium]|nr:TIGR02217 family protein [Alphaproteobacteria bacterium]
MAFVDVRFPTDIAYGSAGGPEYSTDVVITQSGHEQRNSNWSAARASYNVAHGVKTQAQLDALIAFFRARKGRAIGFRFKDWTDFSVTGQVLGEGDGVRTAFQLIKTYDSGAVQEMRIISKPVAATVKIYLGGILQDEEDYVLNTSTGLVMFDAPPADGVVVSADFEFDVPVRFDTDRLSATLDAYGVHSWHDIPLVEVRV